MPAGVKEASLATPLDMAVASDGTLYVAAFGSSAVGVFDTAELENDTFVPDAAHHIEVSGGGPSGLALDEANHRLYVLTRFDDAVKVIDTASRARDRPAPAAQSRAAGRGRRAALPVRRALHVEQRRGVVRDAATSSPTSTASPGTSATRTTSVKPNLNPLGTDGRQAAVSPDEGTDDDADAARSGASGTDALARRSHRRHVHRRPAGARRDARLRGVQRRVRLAARARRGRALRRRHEGVHRLRAADHAASQPGAQPRQPAHCRAGATAATSSSTEPRSSTRPRTAAAVTR